MSRLLLLPSAFLAVVAAAFALSVVAPESASGDVGGVYSNVPVFTPGQVVTITVTAEDDDGTLVIESSLDESHLTVIQCSGIGSNQDAGQCDGTGMSSVFNQGSTNVRIDTDDLDDDRTTELLTVTLNLVADCDELTAVTVSGDQPGNFGPDDVTINCQPATPSPTPTKTPTKTPTPSPTATASPSVTPSPTPTFTPQPPAAPTATPFSEIQTIIKPPSTGSAGLR